MQKRIALRVLSVSAAIILSSCAPGENSAQRGTNSAHTPNYPCVQDVCLGITAPTYATQCSRNLSKSTAASVQVCTLDRAVSIAGTSTSEGNVMLINGKSAQFDLHFRGESCNFVRDSMFKTFSKPTLWLSYNDTLNDLHALTLRLVGQDGEWRATTHISGSLWQTKNGWFTFYRPIDSPSSECAIHVGSLQAYLDLDTAISAVSNGVFKG